MTKFVRQAKATKTLLVAALAALALVSAGCGDDDQCADKTCDFGECDSQTGECLNPSACDRDEECLPGFLCSTGSCEAESICTSDADCETGVCEEGACVNPPSCDRDADCLERTFCGPDSTCESDPCNGVSCARGTCDRGTEACVSEDTCTSETEVVDCIAGEKCAGGTCEPQETFCQELDCERGECSFEEGGCTNRADCEGDDANCVAGFFCNDQDRCQIDLCQENNVACGDDGVCNPASGECVHADTCEDDGDCRDDHLCVDGTCRHASTPCGDAAGDGGCPGNRVCKVDDNEAECIEPDVCETSIDCFEGRQCGGLTCIDAVVCADDGFEPNDSRDQALDLLAEADGGQTVVGTVCEEDVDVFTFNSGELLGATSRGVLSVELEVPRRDRGLGELEVELTDARGDVRTATAGISPSDGTARINQQIGVADHGQYTVEVRGNKLTEAGMGYELSASLVYDEADYACQHAIPIEPSYYVTGDTHNGLSAFFGSECLGEPNEARELVYELELETPRQVTFDLEPLDSSTDLSMSVRSDCNRFDSERGCVDEGLKGDEESLTAMLDAGTHYLIVQPKEDELGGPFELTVDSFKTICGTNSNYCDEEGVSYRCDEKGGDFNSVECEAGCRPSTGECLPPAGDTCESATVVSIDDYIEDDEGLTEPVSTIEQIDLEQRNDVYEVTEPSCLGNPGARTEGADHAFQIEVPANTAMTAHATFDIGKEGSLYAVADCGAPDATCIDGAAGSTEHDNQETLSYVNDADRGETFYVIVDSIAEQSSGFVEVEFTYEPLVCDSGELRCDGQGNVEACNGLGTRYEEAEDCEHGCNNGLCLDGDTCPTATPAGDGFSDTRYYNATENYLQTGTGNVGQCSFDSYNHGDNPEWIYAIDLSQGDVLEVTYDGGINASASSNGLMYILDDCEDVNTCLHNYGAISTSEQPYTMTYEATKDGTVYLVVSRWSGNTTSFDFGIDIAIN